MTGLRTAILNGARRGGYAGSGALGTRPGDGLVFDRIRAYAPGDEPRRIDWAATARIGSLQTRVYVEDTVLVLAAFVDESASMSVGRTRPLLAAAQEAIDAWFASARGDDRVRRIVDDRVVSNRGAVAEVRGVGPFSFARSLELALRALPRGASLLAITDGFDLDDDDERLLRAAQRFDATVLLARDPWADGLPLAGFVRIRDAETGRSRRVFINRAARERYARATAERAQALQARFLRTGWRTGTLREDDGAASLGAAFGIA